MSLSSLNNDSCSYEEKLRQTTGPGMYSLATPYNDYGKPCKTDIPADPYVRYQKFGPNACAPGKAIDDSSELEGLNYRTTKCSNDQYMPGKYSSTGACAASGKSNPRSCLPPTEDTRLSNPPCTLHSTGWNRWEWLCWNPQDRALIPFEWNTSYRIVAKDNFTPCFETPLDQSSFYPNAKDPDNQGDDTGGPVWIPPADCGVRTNHMSPPYYVTYETCKNMAQIIHRGSLMDIYASAALTGLGYSLTKDRDVLKSNEKMKPMMPNEKPPYRNVYRSDILVNTDVDELTRGTNMWNKAQNPIESGVVPRPAYADQFAEPRFNEAIDTTTFQSLSGQVMKASDLKHNNMQKFIGMKETEQFDNFDKGAQKLEVATGRGYGIQRKTEVPCFFEPTSGFGYVNGMPNTTEFMRDRITKSRNHNNDFPIDQVRVGPGLGKGFTSEPSGGFQQAYTLDIIRPKNVDELRVATNPRIVYELPPQGPAGSQINASADVSHIGEFSKNLPDKFYEQTEDMFLKTTGAYYKEKMRPIEDVKPTARVESHVLYDGPAYNRNAEPGVADKDSFRKDSVLVFNNNREITGERTVLNNFKSTVNAIIAPLLDFFRHTKSEYLTDSARPNGNLQAQIPSKATTYDPVNHMMRTTIKETTVQDTTVLNLRGNEKLTLPNEDEARTTIRQTTKEEDYSRNIASHKYRVTVYNTDEVARTTVRNTTPQSGSMYGFVGGNTTQSTGGYNVTEIDLKNNVKQYTSLFEYEGIAGSKADFRPKSGEAELNAEIDGTRDAINEAAGHTPNGAGGFTSLDPDKVNQESKRLITDDFTAREVPNKTQVWQATAKEIPECAITKPAEFLNANEDRLDHNVLSSLSSNPYNLAINPIVDTSSNTCN